MKSYFVTLAAIIFVAGISPNESLVFEDNNPGYASSSENTDRINHRGHLSDDSPSGLVVDDYELVMFGKNRANGEKLSSRKRRAVNQHLLDNEDFEEALVISRLNDHLKDYLNEQRARMHKRNRNDDSVYKLVHNKLAHKKSTSQAKPAQNKAYYRYF